MDQHMGVDVVAIVDLDVINHNQAKNKNKNCWLQKLYQHWEIQIELRFLHRWERRSSTP